MGSGLLDTLTKLVKTFIAIEKDCINFDIINKSPNRNTKSLLSIEYMVVFYSTIVGMFHYVLSSYTYKNILATANIHAT